MPGVILDIGTGDGEFVYKLARENPDRYIIGIEPNHRGLEKISTRTGKKTAKGGIDNALFILSRIEELPEELNGTANQVFINFPWAGLLKGLLTGADGVWNSLKRVCHPGAYIDILFSYQPDTEDNELNNLGLPPIDMAFINETTLPRLLKHGLKIVAVKEVETIDIKSFPTSWAKRLSYGRERNYYFLRVRV
jgi:16S rRNA (adenine(1408)-N(1))-methyltransferase